LHSHLLAHCRHFGIEPFERAAERGNLDNLSDTGEIGLGS
jgi:hypothetical protein